MSDVLEYRKPEIAARDPWWDAPAPSSAPQGWIDWFKSRYAIFTRFSPLAFALPELEDAFLAAQLVSFSYISEFFTYLSLVLQAAVSRDFRRRNADGSLAEPVACAAVVGALLLLCTLLACMKWLPTFYKKYYREIQACVRVYLAWQSDTARAATPCQPVPDYFMPFLGWFALQSHAMAIFIVSTGFPLGVGLHVVSLFAMLVIASRHTDGFCSTTLAPMYPRLGEHFDALANSRFAPPDLVPYIIGAAGVPITRGPKRGPVSCQAAIMQWEVATCIASFMMAVIVEALHRRAFLVTRPQLLGDDGLAKAKRWPLGDVRGIHMCLLLVVSTVCGSFLVSELFMWQ